MPRGVNVAGVIHQHIDGSKTVQQPIEHRVYLRLARNVGGDADGFGNAGGHAAHAVFVKIVDCHQRAFRAETLRDGAADAVSGAGDQHNFPGKSYG